MSQVTADVQFAPEYVIPPVKVDMGAVTLGEGGGKKLSTFLLFAGVVALIATAFFTFSSSDIHKQAHGLVAYLVGFAVAMGLGLGSLGYVMIFQQTNAGWSTTIRRVAEVVASCLPWGLLLALPILIFAPKMYHWFHALEAGDMMAQKKSGFLSPAFWYFRTVMYFAIWGYLGWKLLGYSREQDTTGDRWLTARARRLSAPGLLVFALTTAFAAFDWLMSLDYHWFSTMFGVYYFAGAIQSATALCIIIVGALRLRGKLKGYVNDEHFHDLGKLLLTFTVFWAYIGFSQYFLIWYSNLPEETHWFNIRAENGWDTVGTFLVFGRFLVPFLLLLWRSTKRVTQVLMLIAAWQLFMQVVDMFYVARPTVYGSGPMGFDIVDVFGPIGPIAIFLGIVVRRLGTMPLIPVGDPRLSEAVNHVNLV